MLITRALTASLVKMRDAARESPIGLSECLEIRMDQNSFARVDKISD